MSELVIQLQNRDGNFSCERFDNLPSPKSVYIAICFTDNNQSEQLAIDLKLALINSINNLGSGFISFPPPCGGHAVGFNGCQALSIPDNFKLLIVVSDGLSNVFVNPAVLNWTRNTLPVLQMGIAVTLPPPFNLPQVAFWNNHINEIVPTLFGIIGISEEDQRIFISYKRTDTEPLAIQLFDRLNHEGFEVFLDRFSIQPGINFQNRLYQELSDKAMVLFLESPNFLASEWVQYEIAFAKKYRLGLLAINIGHAPKSSSIENDRRKMVPLTDLGADSLLLPQPLDNLIRDIKEQHSLALFYKKHILSSGIIAALKAKGAYTNFDGKGFINVTNRTGNANYKIWPVPRPPKVDDYHFTDLSNTNGERVIVGPEFMEDKRKVLNTWLSEKSVVRFYNEGQLLDMADLIYT